MASTIPMVVRVFPPTVLMGRDTCMARKNVFDSDPDQLWDYLTTQYEAAKDLITDGKTEGGEKILFILFDILRKQAPTKDDMWELRVRLLQMRIAVDLKSIAFGLPGFDSWDA